jgi:gliding motility-associated lipoprotein GldH
MNRLVSLLTLFSFLLIACGPNIIYESKKDISNSTWLYKDSIKFAFEIKDTNKVYNIWLDIDHNSDYPFQNLYTKIYTHFPQKEVLNQQLSIELADFTGKWNGTGTGKNIKYNLLLQENAVFEAKGAYTIVLEQYTRQDSLKGINELGLRLEETKINKEELKNKEYGSRRKNK